MKLPSLSHLWHPHTSLPAADGLGAAAAPGSVRERLNAWAIEGKPVLATEIPLVLQQLQRERGLTRSLSLDVHPEDAPRGKVQQTAAKRELYGVAGQVGQKWWNLTRPLVEAKKAQLLRAAGAGEFLDANVLEDELDRVLHACVEKAFEALPLGRAETYQKMLYLKQKLTGEQGGAATIEQHFSRAVRTGTSMQFTALRNVTGLPRGYLKEGGVLPQGCASHARALFHQPFVREALALPNYLATTHLGVSSAVSRVMRLSDVFPKDASQPDYWQLLPREDGLHLALTPAGARHAAEHLPSAVEALMAGDHTVRFGCPAMRIVDADPLRPELKTHVLEYLKQSTLQLAEAHVFPVAAAQLRDLHAQAAAAL